MSFSNQIKEDISALAARHCCVCHQHKGNNLEVHHIEAKAQGGEDTLENAILLCFDCHADAGHYFAGHPKGLKLSPSALKKHKNSWLEIVKENKINIPVLQDVSLSFSHNERTRLNPVFIRKTTIYKDIKELRKIDYKSILKDLPPTPLQVQFLDPKVDSFEDFINFINGEHIKKLNFQNPFENNSQPVHHSMDMYFGSTKSSNESICLINLILRNNGLKVLEDFKVYLKFENVVCADTVNKNTSYIDFEKYDYNVIFNNKTDAVFIPDYKVLVQKDFIELDQICFRTEENVNEIKITWHLLARDYDQKESFNLKIHSTIVDEEDVKYVESPEDYEPEIIILDKVN
ncbi:HNH endonuclease [Flammeovirga yaeyamensis]|uniref:HNH endonuclease n=1 Tax=Flammeovirga yaeyamensis TaxID=367791 RepID=A0AAX1NEK1_9BACT|nr:HNH endonuclease [Flammeovirga yaeyamensis]MBB3697042.1 hypothetical protein [Flammeovirga yaeyamensis]QWG05030.1 HNH endonuclease [Flammeovirga yaeyamensis]